MKLQTGLAFDQATMLADISDTGKRRLQSMSLLFADTISTERDRQGQPGLLQAIS